MAEAESHIDNLPNEILNRLLSSFSTKTLESTLSRVCLRWESQTEAIISLRLAKMQSTLPSGMLAELRTHFTGQNADINVLKEFERVHMNSSIELQDCTQDFPGKQHIEEFWKFCGQRSKQCKKRDMHKLENEVQFIPCFNLIAVQITTTKIEFYHESGLSRPGPYQQYEFDNSELKSNGVTTFDVFHDKLIVLLNDTKRLIIYQITNVDHDLRNLELLLVKRIFVPFWISSVKLFNDKVFMFFTTGDFGIWQESTDSSQAELVISQKSIVSRSFGGVRVTLFKGSAMFRVQNLLFIVVNCTVAGEQVGPPLEPARIEPRKLWFLWDMNNESPDAVQGVPMAEIEARICRCPALFTGTGKLIYLTSFGNVIIFHSEINTVAAVLKSDPKKEDFLDLAKFSELIDHGSSSLHVLRPRRNYLPVRMIPESCFKTGTPIGFGVSVNTQRFFYGPQSIPLTILGDNYNLSVFTFKNSGQSSTFSA